MSAAAPPSPPPPPPAAGRERWILPLLAALVPAVFALSTNNIWEDFFITFRCSLNLAQGHGLVYEPGRLLHVFTSPLGTLLPAAISWVGRTGDAQAVLNVFRLVACGALGLAWWQAARGLPSRLAVAVAGGLWLLDPKLAAFSTNGMETALLVLGVVLAWRGLTTGDARLAGLALGGVMWTRPDGFVYVGALAVATVVLDPSQRRNARGAAQIAAWGAAIYLPWFLWAWWYYGSPVPHTIVAKSSVVGDTTSAWSLASYPWRFLAGHTAADDAFLPPYCFLGGWPRGLWIWGKLLSLAALAAAAWPRCARPTRIAGLAFVLGGVYLELTPRAPWYFPAWAILAYLAAGGLAAALAGHRWAATPGRRAILAGAAAGLLLVQAALFLGVSVELREQQRLVEWGLRARLGRDLRQAAASPADRVLLEPLGYIGYFSGLAMRDTPGLCSPEVVALRRAGHRGLGDLAITLRPEWVVLRVGEYAAMDPATLGRFHQAFRLWAQYDIRDQVARVPLLPGRGFLEFDANYLLWRRQPGGPAAPPP